MEDMTTTPLDDDRFGEVVRTSLARAREAKGLTQAQVAEALGAGWTRDRVARIENGRVRPLFVDIVHLSIALDLDIGDLLKGTSEGRFVRAQAAKRAAALFAAYADLEGSEDPLVVVNPAYEATLERLLAGFVRPPEAGQ